MIVHSYNGGGIRSYMVAYQMYRAQLRSGKGISPDIYAGTSGGAILASLRATGNSWIDICRFFSVYGCEIFKKSFFPRIFRSKYSDEPLNRLLKKYLGENRLLQDVEGCILAITTVNTSTDSLCVWTNKGTYEIDEYGNHRYTNKASAPIKLWEVVRASSSAPRYFSRYKLHGVYHEDGGIKANNPSQLAYNIARTLTSEPIGILSITTGRKTHSMKESEANDGVQVAGHVIDSALDALDENVHFSMSKQVRPEDSYIRIETQITASSGEVDDASKANIDAMTCDALRTFLANMDKYITFV